METATDARCAEVMSITKSKRKYKFVLLAETHNFGEFSVEGIFDSEPEAVNFARDELADDTKHTVRYGRYY